MGLCASCCGRKRKNKLKTLSGLEEEEVAKLNEIEAVGLVLVGKQFCKPDDVILILKEGWGSNHENNIDIFDTTGDLQFQVNAKSALNNVFRFRMPSPWNREARRQMERPLDVSIHERTEDIINYMESYLHRSEPYRNTMLKAYGMVYQEKNPEVAMACDAKQLLEALIRFLENEASMEWDLKLSEVFLINNFQYIVNKLLPCSHELFHLAGSSLARHMELFKDMALAEVLAPLSPALAPFHPTTNEEKLLELEARLRQFNKAFEGLALDQLRWTISDSDCRNKVRAHWAAAVKEAYAEFLLPHIDILPRVKFYHWYPDNVEELMRKRFFSKAGQKAAAQSNDIASTKDLC